MSRLCRICDFPMEGHPQCRLCDVLMGEFHTWDVASPGLCAGCARDGLTVDAVLPAEVEDEACDCELLEGLCVREATAVQRAMVLMRGMASPVRGQRAKAIAWAFGFSEGHSYRQLTTLEAA